MTKITWSNRALNDLHAIREYYLPNAPTFAERITDEIFGKIDLLENHPLAGRIVPEFQENRLRELITGRYRIIYELMEGNRVDITTIHPSAIPLQ